MRTSKYSPEQIAQALRQAESGTPIVEICRKLQVTEQTFYRWKKKFGELGTPEIRELRQLREENRKLKQLVADPGAAALETIEAGATVTGRVTKIMPFGAFIEIAPGIEGLVHISEISHERIPTVEKALRKDEIVTCKVLSIDSDKKRISLSIKSLIEPPARPEPQASGGAGGGKGPKADEGFGTAFGRRRGKDDVPTVARPEDGALRRLRATWGGDKQFKGGLS